MRQLWLFITLFCGIAGAAHAQQLAVRSGDHPTFSRLTVAISPSQEWTAEQVDREVRVNLTGYSGGFDTADVFTRMRQDRVSALSSGAGTLTLQLACDCNAAVFRSGPLLVVDVGDRGTALVGRALSVPQQRPKKNPVADRATSQASASPIPWIGGPSPFGVVPAAPVAQNIKSEPADDQVDRAALLQEIQQTLVAEVATAASIGLLENSYATPQAPETVAPDLVPNTSVDARPLPETLRTPSRNLRITSSMDTPNGDNAAGILATTSGLACPAQDFVAVGDWGNDSGFSAQIGPARNALMNARDQLDVDAAKTLTRLYLYFGFGAEARATLRLDPDLRARHPELAAVAAILEDEPQAGRNVLNEFTDCNTDVALWAALSFRDIPADSVINTDAMLLALNKLPQHLRQILAPMLSRRLLTYGDTNAAEAALRSIERLPAPLDANAMMAQADIAIDAGTPAQELLTEVIEDNGAQSPEALVKLVEGKLSRDEPLSYETATLVEAFVQELRGTEMGNQLRRTQIIALSQSQRFDEALSALASLAPSLAPQVTSKLRAMVLEQLGRKADEMQFLEHVFAQKGQGLEELPTPTKLALAGRMMDLGFAAEVQHLLETVPDTPRSAQRQILAARAAIDLLQPFQAQAALIGVETPEAKLLSAKAKEMTGAYAEAAEIFSQNDAMEEATRAAWLSEDWQSLRTSDMPAFDAVATLAQAQSPVENPDLGPLGRAGEALSESTAARETLEQLLRDPMVQIPPTE